MNDSSPLDSEPPVLEEVHEDHSIRTEIFKELDKLTEHYDTTIRTLAKEVRGAIASLKYEHTRLLFTQALTVVMCIVLMIILFFLTGKLVFEVVSVLRVAK